MPAPAAVRRAGPIFGNSRRDGGPRAYRSTMCSTGDGTDPVVRLGRAIDELADAAGAHDLSAQDVASRLAAVWAMVAGLDPELARRLARYTD